MKCKQYFGKKYSNAIATTRRSRAMVGLTATQHHVSAEDLARLVISEDGNAAVVIHGWSHGATAFVFCGSRTVARVIELKAGGSSKLQVVSSCSIEFGDEDSCRFIVGPEMVGGVEEEATVPVFQLAGELAVRALDHVRTASGECAESFAAELALLLHRYGLVIEV